MSGNESQTAPPEYSPKPKKPPTPEGTNASSGGHAVAIPVEVNTGLPPKGPTDTGAKPDPAGFPSVNLVNAAIFNSDGVTIQPGKKLVLAGAATSDLEAVTLGQFNAQVSMLDASLNIVKKVITDVVQDASGAFNTLVELYQISEKIQSEGIQSVQAETTARQVKDTELDSRLFTIRNLAVAGGVYADAQQPSDIPTALLDVVIPTDPNIITDDGWYYKNPGQIAGLTTAQKKINWYTTPNATTVSDLKEINMPVNLINTVSSPFFTVYTKFQGPRTVDDGNGNQVNNWGVGKQNGAHWYHGKYTFQLPPSTSKGKYNLRISLNKVVDNKVIIDGSAPHNGSYAGFSNLNLVISSNSNIEGSAIPIPFLATDEILSCSFGTDSGSSAGNVELILTAINYYCTPGNVGFRFSNADVLAKKLKATMGASP